MCSCVCVHMYRVIYVQVHTHKKGGRGRRMGQILHPVKG